MSTIGKQTNKLLIGLPAKTLRLDLDKKVVNFEDVNRLITQLGAYTSSYQQGNWTAVLQSSPTKTTTAQYYIVGNLVSLVLTSDLISNSPLGMTGLTLTGVPAICNPIATRYFTTPTFNNSSTFATYSNASINTSGLITLSNGYAGATFFPIGFATAGAAGIAAGVYTYPIYG